MAGSAGGSSEQPDAETQPSQGSSRSLPQPRGTILPPGEPPRLQQRRFCGRRVSLVSPGSAPGRGRCQPQPLTARKRNHREAEGKELCQSRHRLSTAGTCTIFSLITSNQPQSRAQISDFTNPLCSTRWVLCAFAMETQRVFPTSQPGAIKLSLQDGSGSRARSWKPSLRDGIRSERQGGTDTRENPSSKRCHPNPIPQLRGPAPHPAPLSQGELGPCTPSPQPSALPHPTLHLLRGSRGPSTVTLMARW